MLETVLRFLKPTRASMVWRIWVGEIWLSTPIMAGSMGAGWVGAPVASTSRFGASESPEAAGSADAVELAARARKPARQVDRIKRWGCASNRLTLAQTLSFIPRLQE